MYAPSVLAPKGFYLAKIIRMDFWKKLERPIIGLSPMDGVTDGAMRFITAKYGQPAVIFTEFVSAEGLVRNKELFSELKYDEIERPVVAQLFGKDPGAFREAAEIVVKLGFDGVDINMGCPSKNVAQHGSGAGLIENRELANRIVDAVHETIKGRIPVSIKTRLGTSKPDESWWQFLAELNVEMVTMHGRTFRQLYRGEADWQSIAKAGLIIKKTGKMFLGNGDIDSISKGVEYCARYGTDGILIGRAALGNPWVFRSITADREEIFRVMIEHSKKFEELNPKKPFYPMRKHLCWYAIGFPDAAELRRELVETNSSNEVQIKLKNFH